MDTFEKALDILSPIADKYKGKTYIHYITKSPDGYPIDPDHLNDIGGDDFCEDCIEEAVNNYKIYFFDKRTKLMGEVFEILKSGYCTRLVNTYDKAGNHTGLKTKRIMLGKGQTKAKIQRQINKVLKTQYRSNTIISHGYYDSRGSESDRFRNCTSCGELFLNSLLLNEQEVEHWETFSTYDLIKLLLEPYHAYQMCEIIYAVQQNDEFANRIEKILLSYFLIQDDIQEQAKNQLS